MRLSLLSVDSLEHEAPYNFIDHSLNSSPDEMEVVVPPTASARSPIAVVLASQPIYIPGSLSAPSSPTIMPTHDKDGIILKRLEIRTSQDPDVEDAKTFFIVSFAKTPFLRIQVEATRVLGYVSSRALEHWYAKEQAQEEMERNEDPRTKAKRERLRQEEEGEKAARGKPERKRKGKKGPAKKAASAEVASAGIFPSKSSVSGADMQQIFRSPQKLNSSPATKQRGLAVAVHDSESDPEDLVDTTNDHELELYVPLEKRWTPRTVRLGDISGHDAAAGFQSSGSLAVLAPGRKRSPSTRPSTSDSASSHHDARVPTKRPRTFDTATASVSSREAAQIYESLEQQDPKSTITNNSPTKLLPRSALEATSQSTRPSPSKPQTLKQPQQVPDSPAPSSPTSSQEEYEVEALLASRWQTDKNRNPIQYFLVKWLGYPSSENTWESEDNIMPDLITQYNLEQQQSAQKLKSKSSTSTNSRPPSRRSERRGSASDFSSLVGMEPALVIKGRGASLPGDTGDEDELFLPGAPPGRSPYFPDWEGVEEPEGSKTSSRGSKGRGVSFSEEPDGET